MVARFREAVILANPAFSIPVYYKIAHIKYYNYSKVCLPPCLLSENKLLSQDYTFRSIYFLVIHIEEERLFKLKLNIQHSNR